MVQWEVYCCKCTRTVHGVRVCVKFNNTKKTCALGSMNAGASIKQSGREVVDGRTPIDDDTKRRLTVSNKNVIFVVHSITDDLILLAAQMHRKPLFIVLGEEYLVRLRKFGRTSRAAFDVAEGSRIKLVQDHAIADNAETKVNRQGNTFVFSGGKLNAALELLSKGDVLSFVGGIEAKITAISQIGENKTEVCLVTRAGTISNGDAKLLLSLGDSTAERVAALVAATQVQGRQVAVPVVHVRSANMSVLARDVGRLPAGVAPGNRSEYQFATTEDDFNVTKKPADNHMRLLITRRKATFTSIALANNGLLCTDLSEAYFAVLQRSVQETNNDERRRLYFAMEPAVGGIITNVPQVESQSLSQPQRKPEAVELCNGSEVAQHRASIEAMIDVINGVHQKNAVEK